MITINDILSKLKIDKIDLKKKYKDESEEKIKKDKILEEINNYYCDSFFEKIDIRELDKIKKENFYIKVNKKMNIFHIIFFLSFIPYFGSFIASIILFLNERYSEAFYSGLVFLGMLTIIGIFSIPYHKLRHKKESFFAEKINFKNIVKNITLETVEKINDNAEYHENIKDNLKAFLVQENYFLEKDEESNLKEIIKLIAKRKCKNNKILSKQIIEPEKTPYEIQMNYLMKNKKI